MKQESSKQQPITEAEDWFRHGRSFQDAFQWDEAEHAFREAARIWEEHELLNGAAKAWFQLAIINERQGKPEAAEHWLRKALDAFQSSNEPIDIARALHNLADLLQNQPGRLIEARQLAEDALDIQRTLDPEAAKIWKNYNVLAQIADQQSSHTVDASYKAALETQARDFRRLSRDTYRAFAGSRRDMEPLALLVFGTVMAVNQPLKYRPVLEPLLEKLGPRSDDWPTLVAAIRRVLAGERDSEVLYGNLDFYLSLAIGTVLQGISDPSSLADLLPREGLPLLGLEPRNFEALTARAADKVEEAKSEGPAKAGTLHDLRPHADFILATVGACAGEAFAREFIARNQYVLRKGAAVWTALSDAIDRILTGERNSETLCNGLDSESSLIVKTILHALSDRSSLSDLLPSSSVARSHANLIQATVSAWGADVFAREFVAREQKGMRTGTTAWTALADVIDRILAGERNMNALCDGLESGPFIIAGTILLGLSGHSALRDLRTSREEGQPVVEVSTQAVGEQHPDTLTSKNNLATIPQQGESALVAKFQQQEAALMSMNSQAGKLWAQGDHAGARRVQERLVELMTRVRGEEHPDTLTSMNNLAAVLGAQGDYSGARRLEERVLEVRTRVLGEEDRNTMGSMNILAATVEAQGDYARALELRAQVLKILTRVLGENHQATQTAMKDLAALRARNNQARTGGSAAGSGKSARILRKEHPGSG